MHSGSRSDALAIVDAGVLCPIGLDVVQAAASMRAQIHRKQESGWLDLHNERIVLGWLPDELLPPLVPAIARTQPYGTLRARLLQLATPALQEVLGALERVDGRLRAPPLVLVGPRASVGGQPLVDAGFLAQLGTQAGVELGSASRVLATGRAGLFAALRLAARLLEGGHELVVVGGVDSYAEETRLAELERQGRLQTSGPQDAFTPGEGAAFVLVTTASTARHARWRPLALVSAIEEGQEPGHFHSDAPHLGDGLAATVSRLLAGFEGTIGHVVSSLNGERLFSREWGVAMLRNRERFAEPLQLEHPAEFTGDMGAAAAPFMLAVTARHLAEGHHGGPSLLWAASDHAERGALLLHAR